MPTHPALPALELVFRPRCLGCRRPLRSSGTSFCRACIRHLLRPGTAGAVIETRGAGEGLLRALRGGAPDRAAAWALELIRRRGLLTLWKSASVQLVAAAPQNRKGQLRSGLALLAERVAEELGAAFLAGAFRKIARRQQHGLGWAERVDAPCFLELCVPREPLAGARILVVDDVETTGTTLDLCEHLLRQAGAAGVQRFALAKAGAAIPSGGEGLRAKEPPLR